MSNNLRNFQVDTRAILAEYDKGISGELVAERLGVSSSSVYRVLKSSGVRARAQELRKRPVVGGKVCCPKCKTEKLLNEFHKSKDRPDGVQPWCKACNKNKALQTRYGISSEELDIMRERQKGRCAICSRKLTDGKGITKLCVDHCHSTGKTRGLLCTGCNLAIGAVRDDPKLCRKAAEYLEKYQ